LPDALALTKIHMKMKISIRLSPEVLAEIDQLAGLKRSRSAVSERVLQDYLINGAAYRLNLEAESALDYQRFAY